MSYQNRFKPYPFNITINNSAFKDGYTTRHLRMDSLPVQEFSSSDSHWPVGRINQVVHILTVLIGQGIFTAPATDNQYEFHTTTAVLQ